MCCNAILLNGYRGQLLWAAAVLLATLPLGDFQNHTHWYKVGWIPFVTPPVRVGDILGNVAMYVPFGLLQKRLSTRAKTVGIVAGDALLLSFFCETTQLYSHTRFPSSTDLVCNVLGAFIGARWRWALGDARV